MAGREWPICFVLAGGRVFDEEGGERQRARRERRDPAPGGRHRASRDTGACRLGRGPGSADQPAGSAPARAGANRRKSSEVILSDTIHNNCSDAQN